MSIDRILAEVRQRQSGTCSRCLGVNGPTATARDYCICIAEFPSVGTPNAVPCNGGCGRTIEAAALRKYRAPAWTCSTCMPEPTAPAPIVLDLFDEAAETVLTPETEAGTVAPPLNH